MKAASVAPFEPGRLERLMYCPYCHTEYSSDRPCFCQPAEELERQKIEALSRLPLQHPVAINTHNGARVD